MPKASTRFRNRKINFKTRIGIRIGTLDVGSDHDDDDDGVHFDDGRGGGGAASSSKQVDDTSGGGRVVTGVDKDEEREHHLQAVINASAASLSRNGIGLVVAAPSSGRAGTKRPAEPHIPIPDATGIVEPAAYEALYHRDWPYALPSTYIRFSDTVEDALANVTYVMDEDDEAWLDTFNAGQASASSTAANGVAEASSSSAQVNGTPDGRSSRRGSPRKGKEKERTLSKDDGRPAPGRLDEDDFELLMDTFEKVTDETVPGLHLDTSHLPSLNDFDAVWSQSGANPRLASIEPFASFVYTHWRERRLKRDGKAILPPLDVRLLSPQGPPSLVERRVEAGLAPERALEQVGALVAHAQQRVNTCF